MRISKKQLMWEKVICMMNQLDRQDFCDHVRDIAIHFDICCIEYPDMITLIDNDGLTINFKFALGRQSE